MASSGTVTLSTQSVDYPNYSRGAVTLTNVIGWSVNNSGVISFTSISSSDNAGGSWGICGVASWYGVTLEPQVSYNGGASWTSLDTKFQAVALCPSLTNTITTSVSLINQLGSYQLSGNCSLRFLYYANAAPAPSADLPNAFPDSGYSAAVQVPVNVDVSWTATLRYAGEGSSMPSAQTASTTANSYNFTVSNSIPTRANYRFEGWADVGGGAVMYHGGDTVTVQKSSPTKYIYAVWTKYYHPGAILKVRSGSGWEPVWLSHDRTGGACQVLSDPVNGTWTDMRTIDAPTGLGDPPAVYHDSKYFNQRKVGKE